MAKRKVSVTNTIPSVDIESYPAPKEVIEAVSITNEFLTKFLDIYNYKQKKDLRASELRIFCPMLKNPPNLTIYIELGLMIEMQYDSKTIVVYKEHSATSEIDISSGEFQKYLVKRIHNIYYMIMRHGLATVVRTAQKKGAELIL